MLKTGWLVIMVALAGLVALPVHAANPYAHVIPAAKPDLLPDMAMGDPKAAITVVEYASAACSHCAHWHKDVWPQFEAKYVKTGKVRFVFREMLTSPPEYALSAFMTGRCAVARSSDKTSSAPYFAVLDSFFTLQPEYYRSRQIGQVTAEVTQKTGMTSADIEACVADQKGFSAFMANMRAHTEADGVTGTPSFFVNGKRVAGHELSDLDAAIAAVSK